MVFVGNAHCIQIHTGPVCNLKWLDDWFNVLDPEFNLHLKTTGIAELWRVRKPSTDGIVTSWEAFDADGELIVQLFGARKPGEPERDDWRELTARLGCVSIHLNHKLLNKARVMQLKDAGLRILVYTVNKPQRAAELLRWGVDCICTDAIDVIGPNFTAQ